MRADGGWTRRPALAKPAPAVRKSLDRVRAPVEGSRMRVCSECGGELEAAYRFCLWCAAPQRRKLVEFFRAHPVTRAGR